MRQATFLAQGQRRSYWDFYIGFGLSVSVWQVLASLVAWQLASLSHAALAALPLIRWGLALSLAAITWLSSRS